MTASRHINRPRWRPTPEQDEVLRREFATTKTADLAARLGVVYHQVSKRATALGLRKDEAFLNGAGGRLDGVRGMGTRFQPGHVPWTKGRRMPGHGGATKFQPGHLPANHKPIGSLRIESGGYLQRKVSETGYPPRDWVAVHRLVWIEANGPVPDGHVVVFRPGRRTTELAAITLDAVELVTRAELLERNRLPPELRRVAQLRGAITRQINRRLRGEA